MNTCNYSFPYYNSDKDTGYRGYWSRHGATSISMMQDEFRVTSPKKLTWEEEPVDTLSDLLTTKALVSQSKSDWRGVNRIFRKTNDATGSPREYNDTHSEMFRQQRKLKGNDLYRQRMLEEDVLGCRDRVSTTKPDWREVNCIFRKSLSTSHSAQEYESRTEMLRQRRKLEDEESNRQRILEEEKLLRFYEEEMRKIEEEAKMKLDQLYQEELRLKKSAEMDVLVYEQQPLGPSVAGEPQETSNVNDVFTGDILDSSDVDGESFLHTLHEALDPSVVDGESSLHTLVEVLDSSVVDGESCMHTLDGFDKQGSTGNEDIAHEYDSQVDLSEVTCAQTPIDNDPALSDVLLSSVATPSDLYITLESESSSGTDPGQSYIQLNPVSNKVGPSADSYTSLTGRSQCTDADIALPDSEQCVHLVLAPTLNSDRVKDVSRWLSDAALPSITDSPCVKLYPSLEGIDPSSCNSIIPGKVLHPNTPIWGFKL